MVKMPFSTSFPTSQTSVREIIPAVVPNNFNHSMSQGGYLSQVMNHARPVVSSRAVFSSGYSHLLNAERRAEIDPSASYEVSNFAPQTHEVFYSPFAMGNNNMIPLAPPSSRTSDLLPAQHTSGAMLQDYSQVLSAESMAEINRVSLFNFIDTFAPCTREMVCSPFAIGSNTNIPLQFPGASWANNLIPAQQTSRAAMSSDHSQLPNAERMGLTNPARLYNFSGPFSHQTREVGYSSFSANDMFQLQSPVNPQPVPPASVAPSWGDVLTGTINRNVDSLVHSLSYPFASDIQPVRDRSATVAPVVPSLGDSLTGITNRNVDSLVRSSVYPFRSDNQPARHHSDLPQDTVDLPRRVFQCRECSAIFGSPQAFGGHMSCHAKEKRKQERLSEMLPFPKRLNLMPSTSHVSAKNEGALGVYKGKGVVIGESSRKKKNKGKSS